MILLPYRCSASRLSDALMLKGLGFSLFAGLSAYLLCKTQLVYGSV